MSAADQSPTISDDAVEKAVDEALRQTWPPRMNYKEIMRAALAAAAPDLTRDAITAEREHIAAAIEADLIRLIGHREVSDWKDGKVDGLNDAARIAREGGPT